jgi:hypothetical protein
LAILAWAFVGFGVLAIVAILVLTYLPLRRESDPADVFRIDEDETPR